MRDARDICVMSERVLEDMAERHAIGTRKYGVPLTAGDGRDHLIDAYQEALDLAVYLRQELDEQGIVVDVKVIMSFVSVEQREIIELYAGALTSIASLRRVIDARVARRST